ncbi:MAG TPA: glycosyltransferase family 4 protein [Lacipirellulaceae bacterium]|nr:glycosyltransferase family 4 protein [Lacipirellulaceae bacterium]
MSVLIGHPTGNPNSYNAALAYFEAGLLESFCVGWMPARQTVEALKRFRPSRVAAARLERRQFPPLAHAPKHQGRIGEFYRLLRRLAGTDGLHVADHGNRWLMRTMARECHRSTVTALHAYEDCSLWQFMEARRLGKACIYDLPTCYYPEWENVQAELRQRYSGWIEPEGFPSAYDQRLKQKREEMMLADVVLVASRYVEATIRDHYPDKYIVRAPYGVDIGFWTPPTAARSSRPLRFIYAGQVSLRKGIPWLLDAWAKADLRDAELDLVGSWELAESKRSSLPPGVRWIPPCSPQALRDRYWQSDALVFPSFSDGFGLVLLEAMACGLPVIASEKSIGPEIVTPGCGFLTPPGDIERLVELLRWFNNRRDELPAMRREARSQAARCTWSNYRSLVAQAALKFV